MQGNQQSVKRKRIKRNRRLLLCSILTITMVITVCIVLNQQVNQKSHHTSIVSKSEPINVTQGNSTGNSKVDANKGEWYLTLVNKWNPIEGDNGIEIKELSNGERIDKRIYPSLQKMFDAARNDGVYPIVASGYRTGKEQKKIYNDKIAAYKAEGFSNTEAKEEAEFWVAIPGTSEHELGLSVDINADGVNSEGTDVYDWLKANAHRYGFINRYPSGKTEMTGVFHEPWHYRYVGVEAATEIYNQGICLEEYLEQIK